MSKISKQNNASDILRTREMRKKSFGEKQLEDCARVPKMVAVYVKMVAKTKYSWNKLR